MDRRDRQFFASSAVDGFADGALRAAPADHEQVSGRVPVNLGRLERLLEHGELAASHLAPALVTPGVIGDLAPFAVRQPGRGIHSPGLPGNAPRRQAGTGIPVVRPLVGRDRLHGDGRLLPTRIEPRPWERRHARRQIRVAQHDHDGSKGLGDAPCRHHDVEALLDGRGRQNDVGCVAVLTEERREEIRLLDLGGETGARASALNVDDDEGHLEHDGETEELLLERESGARGDGEGDLPRVGCADRHADRGDLVFRLVHLSAVLVEDLAQEVRGGGGGGDRDTSSKAADPRRWRPCRAPRSRSSPPWARRT